MKPPCSSRLSSALAAATSLLLALSSNCNTFRCSAFSISTVPTSPASRSRPSRSASTSAASTSAARTSSSLTMASFGAQELANNALRQSPATTQFYTHKMCPYAQKVWIALEAGSCPYEMQQIDLYGAGGKPDWFLDLNPEGQVPVVTCFGGAKILIDSENILTRLSEGVVEGGDSLKATSSEMEEKVEQWRDDLNDKVKVVGKAAVLKGGKNVKELMELLKSLDVNVEGPYLCGAKITTADCSAFPFLWRIDNEFGPLTEEDHGCGNIRKWLDKCGETEAFKKTIQSAWWWWW